MVLWNDIRITQCLLLLISSAILPLRDPPDKAQIERYDDIQDADRDLGGQIPRSVFGLEGLWRDDVADSVGDRLDAGHGDLLG